MEFDELVFRRGFVISAEELDHNLPQEVGDWPTETVSHYQVRNHPDLNRHRVDSRDHSLILLGFAVNPIREVPDEQTILIELGSSLTRGRDAFFNRLDELSGRFVLFVESDNGAFVVQDAIGSKMVCYDDSNPLVASHPGIIAKVTDYKKSDLATEVTDASTTCFPGVATPYQSVRRMCPNTILNLPNQEVKRFFPRSPLPEKSLDEAVSEAVQLLRTQLKLLNKNHNLAFSLSAGIDSRTTLAASRSVSENSVYCTWGSEGRPNGEVPTVQRVTRSVGIQDNHIVFDLDDKPPESWRSMMNEHMSDVITNGRVQGCYNLYEKFPDDHIEIRSNAAEIGTAYYRNKVVRLPEQISPQNLAKLFIHITSPNGVEAFDKYIVETKFSLNKLYNYDLYDIFYWEFRMGSWLARWLLQKDVSHNNFIAFNNRELLKLLLSVDIKYRKSEENLRQLILGSWPECLDVPINPHLDNQSKIAKQIGFSVAFRMPMQVYRPIMNVGYRIAH